MGRRNRVKLNPTSAYCRAHARNGPKARKKRGRSGRYRQKPNKAVTFSDSLRTLGYDSYVAYLASGLWREIRQRVFSKFGRRCRACGDTASEVHHTNYRPSTMDGTDISGLYPICKDCHRKIHAGVVDVRHANTRWYGLISKRSHGWLTRRTKN